LHSDGFVNSELVFEDPLCLDEMCADLVELLAVRGAPLHEVDRVVGPAMGAITLAHDVARRIGYWRHWSCTRAYAEKEVVNGQNRMVLRRTSISPGESVLLVEDVLTTGQSG
jgi:orotate phosphoribosyltransferase